MTLLMILEKIGRFVSLAKYGIPRIFRYNFSWGSLGLMIFLLFSSLRYSLMMFKLEVAATLLVVKRRPLLSNQIKLMKISDLTSFKSLLMFKTWTLVLIIIFSELLELIRMVTWETLDGHVELQFIFLAQIIHQFVNFWNFFSEKL